MVAHTLAPQSECWDANHCARQRCSSRLDPAATGSRLRRVPAARGRGCVDSRYQPPQSATGRMIMRYRLRTLLILLAVGPIVLAGIYWRSLQPSLEVTQLSFDVRDVQSATGGGSSFQIRNIGVRTIHVGCGARVGRGRGPNFDELSIKPGESHEVWIEWIAPDQIDDSGRIYRCEFLTSDPNRKAFEVEVVGRLQEKNE